MKKTSDRIHCDNDDTDKPSDMSSSTRLTSTDRASAVSPSTRLTGTDKDGDVSSLTRLTDNEATPTGDTTDVLDEQKQGCHNDIPDETTAVCRQDPGTDCSGNGACSHNIEDRQLVELTNQMSAMDIAESAGSKDGSKAVGGCSSQEQCCDGVTVTIEAEIHHDPTSGGGDDHKVCKSDQDQDRPDGDGGTETGGCETEDTNCRKNLVNNVDTDAVSCGWVGASGVASEEGKTKGNDGVQQGYSHCNGVESPCGTFDRVDDSVYANVTPVDVGRIDEGTQTNAMHGSLHNTKYQKKLEARLKVCVCG